MKYKYIIYILKQDAGNYIFLGLTKIDVITFCNVNKLRGIVSEITERLKFAIRSSRI